MVIVMKISKSKRQLAQLIIEAGVTQFPNGANWAAQDKAWYKYTKCAMFYSGGDAPEFRRGDTAWRPLDNDCFALANERPIALPALINNWHQTILSRAEFDQIVAETAPDADGWIEWKGGECPVGEGDRIDVKFSDGDEFFDVSSYWGWGADAGCCNIIAYRLHKPEQAKPEFCESVMRSIPGPEFDDAGSRLAKALELVKSAAPHMLRDKYKFDGNEVMGERKPAIEQLAQDYRNKLDYSNRKQDEADKANMESDAALAQLEDAIAEIGFAITPLAETEKEPELSITNWRDLRVGDEIIIDYVDDYTDWKKNLEGKTSTIVSDGVRFPVCATNESCQHGQSWFLGAPIEIKWRFIRRP